MDYKKAQNQNKESWNNMANTWFGTTALPNYGCYIETEEKLKLFPELTSKSILDIGCGSGHSLKWCADNGAEDLWGIDLSNEQINIAKRFLKDHKYNANLFAQAMESSDNIPTNYFDIVYGIYSLGWTLDLEKTIKNISSYLKTGGVFIFSWDHPMMACYETKNNQLIVSKSYHNENIVSCNLRNNPVNLIYRKMSTYINTLVKYGIYIERLVEDTSQATLNNKVEFSTDYYAESKAQMVPLSFVIKAIKVR